MIRKYTQNECKLKSSLLICRAIEILTMHVSQINIADIAVVKDCSYYEVHVHEGRVSNSLFSIKVSA